MSIGLKTNASGPTPGAIKSLGLTLGRSADFQLFSICRIADL
jgi:hypothetical protein